MNRSCAIAALGVALGCRTPRPEHVVAVSGTGAVDTEGRFAAASLGSSFGVAGFRVGTDMELRGHERADDPVRYGAFGASLHARLSPLGLWAIDHRLEQFLDVGPEIGVGGGYMAPEGDHQAYGVAWAGGWIEVGTIRIRQSRLVLVGRVQAVARSGPWLDGIQIVFGPALVRRSMEPYDPYRP